MIGGFRLLFAGELTVADVLKIDATVEFRLELAGSNPGIELIINGMMKLDPIGEVVLEDSGFRINSEGLVARLDLSIDGTFGNQIGLKFQVTALLQLNTTGRVQTLGSSRVDPGFRLRLTGTVEFLGFAKANGFVDILIRPEGFQLEFAVNFSLGGLIFEANGGAAVVTGSDPGIVLNLNVRAVADLDIFYIEAAGTFQLNTTRTARLEDDRSHGRGEEEDRDEDGRRDREVAKPEPYDLEAQDQHAAPRCRSRAPSRRSRSAARGPSAFSGFDRDGRPRRPAAIAAWAQRRTPRKGEPDEDLHPQQDDRRNEHHDQAQSDGFELRALERDEQRRVLAQQVQRRLGEGDTAQREQLEERAELTPPRAEPPQLHRSPAGSDACPLRHLPAEPGERSPVTQSEQGIPDGVRGGAAIPSGVRQTLGRAPGPRMQAGAPR